MRRLWFTILLAISLAFGGAASAWAAQDCPFKQAPVGAHDCCPENAAHHDGAPKPAKAPASCQLGQACRTVPAVTPLQLSIRISAGVVASALVPPVETFAPPAPFFSVWKPPRSV